MALGWIQLDANLASHRKALHLAALLRDRRAWTYLVQLWAWASQNEPTGRIRGAAARLVVEQVAGWTGEVGAFADAAISAGWIDVSEDGLYIHDWHEHQGAHIANAEKAAERKRQGREKTRRRYGVHETSMGRPEDVHGTGNECPEDVPGKKKTNTKTKMNTEEKEEEAVADATPSTGPVETLQQAWNSLAPEPLPRWRETGKERRRHAQARLRERPLADWSEVIQRIAASRFCRGENDRGWVASPDWLLRPETAAKVLEGKYDNRSAAAPKRDTSRGYVAAQSQTHSLTGYLPDDEDEHATG